MTETKVESGWLIERGMACAPEYLSIGQIGDPFWGFVWTSNHEHALRLGRQIDAEKVARVSGMKYNRIAEHQWG